MAETSNILTLYFAGGVFQDLYPYELELEEGISRLYRGRLMSLSIKSHTREELSELLDRKVTLSLSQRLGEGTIYRTRWLHGIVSAVESRGVISDGAKQDCYLTVLTIEPELARLGFTRHTESFYRVNPVDIAEKLLVRYGLKGNFAGNYINRRKYGPHLMFEERNESCLDFLNRIMGLYGLSYTFCHPKTANSQLNDTGLYFSDGERYPVSDVVYSDKRTVPAVQRFDFLSKDEGQSLWKMDGWRLEDRIGVNGLSLSSAYPESSRGNSEWYRGTVGEKERCYSYIGQFHGYERATPEAEIDEDVKLILDARYLVLRLAKSHWEGETKNLGLVPGLLFELSHFDGRQDKSSLTALVTGTNLRVRTVWPPDLAAPPEVAEGEYVNVRAVCTNFGKDSQKRFAPGH